jgi:hypothetical protein
MSKREREDYTRSNLPYGLKVVGVAVIVCLIAIPPFWACLLQLNWIGMFLSVLLGDVVAKVVWRIC